MTTKARKLERKTRAAELDMEIMRAREANGLPVISPMLGLPPEKWECEFRDYLVARGDPRVADPEWLAARIREEQRRARWFEKWFDAWFEESVDGFDFGKDEVRRPVGQSQPSRRTPEERQEAMKAAMPASRPLPTEFGRAPAPTRSRHSPIPPGAKVGKRRAIGPGPKQLVGLSDASKQPSLTVGRLCHGNERRLGRGQGPARAHAAATAFCHCAAASALKIRSVDRETRCR